MSLSDLLGVRFTGGLENGGHKKNEPARFGQSSGGVFARPIVMLVNRVSTACIKCVNLTERIVYAIREMCVCYTSGMHACGKQIAMVFLYLFVMQRMG